MIYKINNYSSQELNDIITTVCGKKPTIFDRFRKRNFGSTRYLLKDIKSFKKLSFDFDKMNSTYLNFDLWDKGLVFYFRFKNSEYIVTCPYYNTSFQSSDDIFTLQSDDIVFDFKIINKSKHVKFIKNLYKFKNIYNEKTMEHY